MAIGLVAKIAVENTAYHFDILYSYAVPDSLAHACKSGCRVMIPFGTGKTSKKRFGVVFETITGECKGLKKIHSVLDDELLINDEILALAAWMKERFFCTLFEAVKSMLPSGVNHKMVVSYCCVLDKKNEDILNEDEQKIYDYLIKRTGYFDGDKIAKVLKISPDSKAFKTLLEKGYITRNFDALNRIGDATIKMVRINRDALPEENRMKFTAKQKLVIDFLYNIDTASVKEICYYTGVTPVVVKTLASRGILDLFDNITMRTPNSDKEKTLDNTEIFLTDEQNAAYSSLLDIYHSGKGNVSLLFGVTGSGKTSVYMKLIDTVVAEKKGVIVMVPEISLTPQMLNLFYKRYGENVAVFHSALSVGERADEWKRVKQGKANIVVGTRSAVFAPLENIGLIVIDEEQEATYKSESSPRYNAKDVAKFRTAYHNSLLLLSSATPSIETYAAAKSGRYSLFTLNNRYAGAILPEVVCVDLNNERRKGNTTAISDLLLNELRINLENKKQSILLMNRRGYNTFASCVECAHVITCPSCSISMTYHHANSRLMCHYCGHSIPFTSTCTQCGKDSVIFGGIGTQKVEETLKSLLPQARVLRMDTDTTMSRYAHEKRFDGFSKGEYDILIGTQMVAKGLDFENVTLVGVLCAEQQLYNDDYKSFERTFDLLTQVIGRSGRGKYQGKAIIQTTCPENDVIQLAAQQNYEDFFSTEIELRKLLTYPPYCDMCVVSFSGDTESDAKSAAVHFLSEIKKQLASNYKNQKIIALGPMPYRVLRVNNRYRYHLIVKCKNSTEFRKMISEILILIGKDTVHKNVSTVVDINP